MLVFIFISIDMLSCRNFSMRFFTSCSGQSGLPPVRKRRLVSSPILRRPTGGHDVKILLVGNTAGASTGAIGVTIGEFIGITTGVNVDDGSIGAATGASEVTTGGNVEGGAIGVSGVATVGIVGGDSIGVSIAAEGGTVRDGSMGASIGALLSNITGRPPAIGELDTGAFDGTVFSVTKAGQRSFGGLVTMDYKKTQMED
jgi:hypothetical protein